MKFCPNCRGEFQDRAKVCHVCHVPLADSLPAVQSSAAIAMPAYDHIRDGIVTIALFSFPQVARIYSAKLESEGISCFVADEYIVTMNWAYSNAIGWVRLQVLESDVAEARSALGWDPAVEDTREVCPQCGSSDTHDVIYPINFLLWLLLGMLFLKRKLTCTVCGFQWKTRSGLFSVWDWH
jgi:hypothetical protein